MTVKQIFNTSAELDYPTVLPTLDLDFANSKTLDPRITFTRASGGSYIGADGLIKYAGVNEPRFDHDPVTGECKGFLVEEGRTNLITGSNNFATDNVHYLITANSILSPEGDVNASKMTEKTTFDYKIFLKTYTCVPDRTYCHSLFVKAGERNTMRLKNTQPGDIGNTSIAVDMSTGKIIGVSGSPSNYGIIKYPNGWWRIYCTYVPTNTVAYFEIFLRNSTGSSLYTGDGSSGFYIYGAQVEEGNFPTSYIPTVGSTRTRSPDVAKINNANLQSVFPSSLWNENTFYAEAYRGTGTETNPMIFEGFTSVAGRDEVHTTLACTPTNNKIRSQVRQGNSRYEAATFSKDVFFNQKFKASVRTYSRTNESITIPPYSNYPSSIMSLDGTLVYNPFSSIARSDWNSLSELSIGCRQLYGQVNFGSFWNNSISRISLYPKALSDGQMNSLTA